MATDRRRRTPERPLGIALGAGIVTLVSWRDDIGSVAPPVRLLAQLAAAGVAVGAVGYWRVVTLGAGATVDLGLGGLVLTLMWIVGLTNAFNFMDGIDGLAGGEAVVTGAGWALVGWIVQEPLVAAVGVMLAATGVGFLRLNWPPARIFMGDVGSTFLGYTCAVLALLATGPNAGPGSGVVPWVGLLLTWTFVFDSLLTFLRRLAAGEDVFTAHRSHLYQRLTRSGQSHRSVTTLYLALGVAGVLAAALAAAHHPAAPAAFAALPLLAVWLYWFVGRRERVGRVARVAPPPLE